VGRQGHAVKVLARAFQPLQSEWEAAIGHHGYTRASQLAAWPGVRLQWYGSEAQGIHLTVSGKPLQALGAALGAQEAPWAELRHLLAALDAMHADVAVRRLDVAWDNVRLSPMGAIFQQSAGGLVTRLQKEAQQSARGQGLGTWTLGNRAGGAFVRVYDKAAEMSGGDRVLMAALARWYRLEVEYHDERAERVAARFREQGVPGVLAEVDAVVSFRNKEDDPNPSRRSWQDWWAEALADAAPAVRRPPKPTRDVDMESQLSWLRQASASILAGAEAMRGSEYVDEWLQETLVVGRTRRQLDGAKRGVRNENTLPAGD